MSTVRLTPVEEARATIWALMTEEGLSLEDIAFIHVDRLIGALLPVQP